MPVEYSVVKVEDLDAKIAIAAHHEGGHAVIAAVLGRRLRAEGIMVARDAEGLACYCKQPGETDASREATILTTFAGCYAEQRYRILEGYPALRYERIIASHDWFEARQLHGGFSEEYFGGRVFEQVQKELESRSQQLVEEYWPVIERITEDLLAKAWEPMPPLKSRAKWSSADEVRRLSGEELVAKLKPLGINAISVEEC